MHAPFRSLLALIAWVTLLVPWQICTSDCHDAAVGIAVLHGCHGPCGAGCSAEAHHCGAEKSRSGDCEGGCEVCELTDIEFLVTPCSSDDLVIVAPELCVSVAQFDFCFDATSRLIVSDIPRPPPFGVECLRSVVLHL